MEDIFIEQIVDYIKNNGIKSLDSIDFYNFKGIFFKFWIKKTIKFI